MLSAPGRLAGAAGNGEARCPCVPSASSRNREFKSPPGHEQMACGFPRKARCPPGLAAVTALRAGRDDPCVQHPQDVCDSRRAAARRSLNTPPRRRPGFPSGPSSPPCPTPAPSPSPSPSPSGTPSPRARQARVPAKPQQNYDVHRIGNGQPIGRPPSTSRPVCPERVPAMKTIRYPVSPWQSGPNCSATGPDGCSLAEVRAAHRRT